MSIPFPKAAFDPKADQSKQLEGSSIPLSDLGQQRQRRRRNGLVRSIMPESSGPERDAAMPEWNRRRPSSMTEIMRGEALVGKAMKLQSARMGESMQPTFLRGRIEREIVDLNSKSVWPTRGHLHH